MIFTESTIKISNNVSKMDSTIVLYRGDKNVEIRFTILQSPFKYSNTVATNVIESTNASYGQLVIKTPNDKPPIFSDVSATKEGTVLFTITKEMIDEIEEVGVYTFQIRLMDENKQSRVTIPPVENGIEIKEPIAIEDDNSTNVVGLAKANYAVATLSDVDTPTFDNNGKYNKTNWNDGDIITNASLNKIEDGIYTTNENVNTKSVFTNTQLDNKFGALNFTGSLNTGLNKSMTLSEAFPDILDGKYDAIKQCKLTVKVDGATIVNLTENYNMVQWQMYDNDNNLLSTAYSKPKVVRSVYFAPNDYVQFICWLDATYTPGASGSGISYDTPGYITVMLTISRSKNTEEYINKIKNLRITTTLRSLNVLVKDNKVVYTPKEDYNPATKKYVDDNILLEQLPILRVDETNKRIYVNCNNMGTYKKYFVPNKYANAYGFSFIYTNEDKSETEIALIGGAMTRDDFILCARNTNTLFILILGGTDKYTYTKSTKTLEKGLYGYLKIGNTQEYTPTNDYNPATKKYVDDNMKTAINGVIPNKSITLDKLSFVTTGKNLLNKNTAEQGKCLKYNETTLYNKDDYYVSDFIEIEPSTQYTCNYMYGYAYYDSEKAGISGHTPTNVGSANTITTPENVKYIRLNIYKTLISKTQFEKGATATSFEDYYAYIGNQYVQRQPFIADEVPDKSLSVDKLDFIKYTKNLFDASKVSEKGWYINYTNGAPESNEYTTTLCYSDYIKVEQGEYIVNEILHSYAYFDKNKKYISGATSFKAKTVLTIPANCKYVVINIYYDNKEKYQLQKGNVATPLEPYGYNLEGMIDNVEGKNILSLPEKYELVVGDTFELFYKGIMLCNNPYNYNIKISCPKGSAYSKRYIFTPVADDIGTHKMTISIIDDDEKLLAYKTINLVVKNKASSPTTNKNVLCVGDSLTVNGVWASELCRRLTGTSGNPVADGLSNVKFIGTCNGTNGTKFEGYGGWNYGSYNSAYKLNSYMWITTTHTKTQADQHSIYKDTNGTQWKLETIETGKIKLIRINDSGTLPTTGTLKWVSGGADKNDIVYSASEIAAGNPFWNESSEKVDFSNYATSLGVTSIDYCYVLLGWNQSYLMETEYKQSAKTFINNLLTSFPNCKIGLVGLEVPSLDGLGKNYGCDWNYYDKLKFVFNVNQWYFDLSQEFDNVDFINLAGQFDSENNMRTDTRQVNTRNSKTEIYGINGVHPADEGYLQIADAVYRHITHLL